MNPLRHNARQQCERNVWVIYNFRRQLTPQYPAEFLEMWLLVEDSFKLLVFIVELI